MIAADIGTLQQTSWPANDPKPANTSIANRLVYSLRVPDHVIAVGLPWGRRLNPTLDYEAAYSVAGVPLGSAVFRAQSWDTLDDRLLASMQAPMADRRPVFIAINIGDDNKDISNCLYYRFLHNPFVYSLATAHDPDTGKLIAALGETSGPASSRPCTVVVWIDDDQRKKLDKMHAGLRKTDILIDCNALTGESRHPLRAQAYLIDDTIWQ